MTDLNPTGANERGASVGLPTAIISRITNMTSSDLPRHIVDRFERRWAQKLEAQAHTWQSHKPGVRAMTDRGVPVVHRRKRLKLAKAPFA
jgi:hypothetical protein